MSLFLTLIAGLAACVASKDSESVALPVDDECTGSDESRCTVALLQNRLQTRLLVSAGWVELIEGAECPSTGAITCERVGAWRHFKFPAGEFTVSRQVSVPEHTIIEGNANPNGQDKTKTPDYDSQTVFVASEGLSDSHACYCQNLERSWEPLSPSNPYHCQDLTNEQVTSLRKGFLMYSNTVVKNIAFQGKDTLRPFDNGALCGGGVFETPGCVHNQCLFPHLKTGDGKPVTNVSIENVRLNDYLDDPELASQLAVWVAQTSDTETPTSEVHVKNLVAMFLHADGINFHGFVRNAIVDDSYIQNTGDDIYAVWGSNFDSKGIVFQNSVAVDAGRARQNHYGSCVAVYGATEATFRNLTCFAPEQNTVDCYDAKDDGDTCNGCLGIIKESFDADYSNSVFTFTGNKFYSLKRTETNGRQIYDLTNPQNIGRPEVCNNEWTRGGLRIIED
mmetsp:Transcript_140466/g.350185  ORF Transcript_140466/g.350185 Transcript_140466/m.350185 type:complete len:449 (+) Transcript_140466:75-1421(+)